MVWQGKFKYRICIVFTYGLIALISALLIIIFLFLRNPQKFIGEHIYAFAREFGIEIKFDALNVSLLPYPALSVQDLIMYSKQIQVKCTNLIIQPQIFPMLKGEFVPAKIQASKPELILGLNAPLFTDHDQIVNEYNELIKKFKNVAINNTSSNNSCHIKIIDGVINIQGENEDFLISQGIGCNLNISNWNVVSGEINIKNFQAYHAKNTLLSLNNFSLAGKLNISQPYKNMHNIQTKGNISIPGLLYTSSFYAFYNSLTTNWFASTKIDLDINLNETHIPASISFDATQYYDSTDIQFSSVHWQIDADNGQMDVKLSIPDEIKNFRLDGMLSAKRVSLTQWLGFARNLAPGLQISLDNISQVKMNFSLNSNNLKVTDIEANCSGAKFTGSGSVSDFSKPVVFLDMKTNKANLRYAIPESTLRTPEPPFYPYPTLTPMPGEPLKPGEEGIGYDIRLGADILLYGPLTINDVHLQIIPGQMDQIGIEDVLLIANARLYDGQFDGECILGADPSMPCNIKSTITNVNGKNISADMSSLPFTDGTFNAKINVFSKGLDLDTFLNNLTGDVNVYASKAVLKGLPNTTFSQLNTSVKLSSACRNKHRAGFSGQWQGFGKMTNLTTLASMNGTLWMDNDGVSINDLPANIELNFDKSFIFIPPNTKVKASCIVSAQTKTPQILFSKSNIQAPDFTISGDINFYGNTNTYKGKISCELNNIMKLANKLSNKNIDIPSQYNKIKFITNFVSNENSFICTQLQSSIGETSLSGSVTCQTKSIPSFNFEIVADKINLDTLFKKNKSKNSYSEKLNYEFLKKFNLSGSLKIDNLGFLNLNFKNLSTKIKLESAKASITQIKADFYNANFLSNIYVDFNKGIDVRANISSYGFNLEKMFNDMNIKDINAQGVVSIDSSINAKLQSSKSFINSLNGNWNASIYSGSWQSLKEKTTKQDNQLIFNRASASGKIVNGKIESNDLTLITKNMNINGSGWLDLDTNKVDYKFNVDMNGLPIVPLHLYGQLNDVKTSVETGQMLKNAIKNISSSFVQIIGNILFSPIKIFTTIVKPNKK